MKEGKLKKEILELSARKEFLCLGSDCPRDCCHGWDKIEVDENTLAMWKGTQDTETKKLLVNFISTSDDGISLMKKTEEKNCIALNAEKLCDIQLQYGHEYLSDVCRSFPRINFNNYYREYHSASFSCPLITEKMLFDNIDAPLFFISDNNEQNNKVLTEHEKLLYALDILLTDILEKTKYSIGVSLFFISDIFVNIINMSQSGDLTEGFIQQLQENVDAYLTDISKAVKQGKLKPNSVTAGSFWKSIYELCETRDINEKYLGSNSTRLKQEVGRCDGSFAGFSKIYAIINQYRKKGKKQIKQQYTPLLRKYIKILFINKGFPLAPKHTLDLILVDCMVNFCVLQLLMWIEINKNGKITDEFIKDCIVEIDRKFVLNDGVLKRLEENPHMIQIEKYCSSFVDLF